MNEQIRKLYEQAHIEHRQEYFSSVVDPTIKSVSVTRHFNLDLFAELIVQECIDIVGAGGEFASRPKLVEKLQEHFGVKNV